MQIEHNSIIYPRFSSDYCFYVPGKGRNKDSAVFGICDTIGQTSFRSLKKVLNLLIRDIRNLLRDKSLKDINDLDQAIKKELAKLNEEIIKLTPEFTDEPFGLCLLVGIIHQGQTRYIGLGDCRAYLIREFEHADPDRDVEIRILTEDHNRLYMAVTEEGSYTFMKNELTGFSKTLTCFWGSQNKADFEAKLNLDGPSLALQPGDHLLFVTDGIYFPIVRYLMKQKHYTLSTTDYFLVDWLGELIDELRFNEWEDGRIAPKKLLTVLTEISMDLAPRGSRYRDDMAGLLLSIT